MRSNSIWRRFAAMPPIDWALLVVERSRGRRHSPATIAKIKTGRAKALKARQREASKRYQARRQAERPARARNVLASFLGAMEPGEWYARPDIRDLSGLGYGSVKGLSVEYEAAGWICRCRNADHAPGLENKGVPMWLFALTPAGEERRIAILNAKVGQTG
jgi:hypothetical protein